MVVANDALFSILFLQRMPQVRFFEECIIVEAHATCAIAYLPLILFPNNVIPVTW